MQALSILTFKFSRVLLSGQAGIGALYRGVDALGNMVYKALEGVQAGLVSTV